MVMKILINVVLVAAFLGLGLWAGPHLRGAYDRAFPEPAFVTGDYAEVYRQAANKPVVMYSTSTCPHCAHAREFLTREKVDFQDFVIDQSPEAKSRFEALGGSTVPVLYIGDRRIVGFREDTIRESLALIRH